MPQQWPQVTYPGLDLAEPTWEEAIVAPAAKVSQRYGDNRARALEPPSRR